MSKEIGIALYNAAASIFAQFDASFSVPELTEHDDPRTYVGSIDINAEDSEERVMTVSATVEYKVEWQKGKRSHYKCNFKIKEENSAIAHDAFRTRTISIKSDDLKTKEKVIAKIKEYRAELTKLVAEGKAKRAANALRAEKNLAAISNELDKIKAGLGDALAELKTSTRASSEDVSVTLKMANGESVYTHFDGTAFELHMLDKRRTFTTDKFVAVLSAVYA